uniref:Uncharacterized protein n=1 Tax=Oryza sativa subsp. japonica TaxID=39947 RepID=Q6EU34_ORYSJ|nr:hypothetical protein [Oryza sativa Japonica Group]
MRPKEEQADLSGSRHRQPDHATLPVASAHTTRAHRALPVAPAMLEALLVNWFLPDTCLVRVATVGQPGAMRRITVHYVNLLPVAGAGEAHVDGAANYSGKASQHRKHQAEQSQQWRGEIDSDGGDGGAEGGVLEERGDAAADAVESTAVGRGGAGGVHVCLEEFSAGDAMAHLPYGRHFHWACALPGSRLAPHPAPAHSAAPSSTRRGRGSGRGR